MKQSSASRWLLIALIVGGALGWAATGLRLYAHLAYLGVLLVAGAGLWTILSMRGARLERRTRTLRASMGEVFEEQYEIRNAAWPGMPWLEVLNQSNLPTAAGSRLLTGIGPHQRRFYAARTLLTRRGAFLLGPTRLTSGDPFGLFTIRREIAARDTLLVMPMVVPIVDFPPPPGILPGGKTVRTRTMDVTPHAAGVREYVPGDPMRRVHWPSTARRGRFMVKEFEQDPQADIWILLDADRAAHASLPDEPPVFREQNLWIRRPRIRLPHDSFEYAVSAAASLAAYFLGERRAVGLACSANRFTIVSAERGVRQVGKLMETLAFLQPDGCMPLVGMVTMQARLLPLGSGVILVTPSVQPELLLAAEDLQRRNLRPVVVMIQTETFGGHPGEGALGAEQMATGLLRRDVPVCRIADGDDLAVQLALPAVYFQRPYLPKAYFSARA
jgi:uncharacterized protein (DUF58 family)